MRLPFKLTNKVRMWLLGFGFDSCDLCVQAIFRDGKGHFWGEIAVCKECDEHMDRKYREYCAENKHGTF